MWIISYFIFSEMPFLTASGVQGTTLAEPLDLVLAHGVQSADLVLLARGPSHHQCNLATFGCVVLARAAGDQIRDTDRGLDHVPAVHLVPVGSVRKGQGQDALLLEVRLVDACKRPGQDQRAAQVAHLQGCVLASRAFSIVVLKKKGSKCLIRKMKQIFHCKRGKHFEVGKDSRLTSVTTIQGLPNFW